MNEVMPWAESILEIYRQNIVPVIIAIGLFGLLFLTVSLGVWTLIFTIPGLGLILYSIPVVDKLLANNCKNPEMIPELDDDLI